MKTIIFSPVKQLAIDSLLDQNESTRMHEVISIIGTVDIKAIPYRDNIIYGPRKDRSSLPKGKGVFGCIVEDNIFLGNVVIIGGGIDRDETALTLAQERLSSSGDRCRLIKGVFSDLSTILHEEGVEAVDGILMDLWVYPIGTAFNYDWRIFLISRKGQDLNLTFLKKI